MRREAGVGANVSAALNCLPPKNFLSLVPLKMASCISRQFSQVVYGDHAVQILTEAVTPTLRFNHKNVVDMHYCQNRNTAIRNQSKNIRVRRAWFKANAHHASNEVSMPCTQRLFQTLQTVVQTNNLTS